MRCCCHIGAVAWSAISRQECYGFDCRPSVFLCGVCMFSLCMLGSHRVFQLPPTKTRMWGELKTLNVMMILSSVSQCRHPWLDWLDGWMFCLFPHYLNCLNQIERFFLNHIFTWNRESRFKVNRQASMMVFENTARKKTELKKKMAVQNLNKYVQEFT